MTVGSWLARKLSDPEFEAWLDERIKVATKAAVAEALERIDEEALAVAVANRTVDRVIAGVRGELAEVVAAFDGRVDQVLGKIDEVIPGDLTGVLAQVRDLLGRLPRWPL